MDPETIRHPVHIALKGIFKDYSALGHHKGSWEVQDEEGNRLFYYSGCLDLRKSVDIATLQFIIGIYLEGYRKGTKVGEELKAIQIRQALGLYPTQVEE